MGYYKAVFNFNRPIEDKAKEERVIYNKMSVIPDLSTPPVPYAEFLVALEQQNTAIDNARFGGRERIAIMRTKERIVDDMVRRYRDFVTEKSNGDTDKILDTGFKHTKTRASAGDMPKVTGVKGLRTDVSGTLKLRWKREDNVAFYEVDVRLVQEIGVLPKPPATDPTGEGPVPDGDSTIVVERPWATKSTKPARITLKGLKPLSQYEVRVRANGTKGYGGYSDVVVMIVT